jgi:hypothetical protein
MARGEFLFHNLEGQSRLNYAKENLRPSVLNVNQMKWIKSTPEGAAVVAGTYKILIVI